MFFKKTAVVSFFMYKESVLVWQRSARLHAVDHEKSEERSEQKTMLTVADGAAPDRPEPGGPFSQHREHKVSRVVNLMGNIKQSAEYKVTMKSTH